MTPSKISIEAAFLTAVLFGGFALSFFIPDFGAQGGANTYNLIICALCAFAFLYLTIRNMSGQNSTSEVKFPAVLLWSLGLFSLVMLITDFTGWYLHTSLVDTLEWFLAFALFFGTAVWVFRSPDAARKFAGCFVVGAALLSLYGFYTFTLQLGYLHLGSVLGEHNAFGGFLLIPLCLSFALALSPISSSSASPDSISSSRLRFFYACTSILIGAGLILTFSRGTWVAFLIALILGGVFFRKNLAQAFRQASQKTLIKAGLLVVLTLLLAGGWYLFANKLGKIEASSVSIYGGMTVPTDSTLDRLEYLVEASRIFVAHPLGLGLGNYNFGAQANRTTVLRFAFDPHNFYVELFVETGLLGGILFVITMLYLFFRPAYRAYAESRAGSSSTPGGESSALVLALLIGVGAALIHAGMDVDMEYPAALFALFISLGMLWGLSSGLLSDRPSGKASVAARAVRFSLPQIATAVAGIVTILFLAEFASTYYALKGNDAVSEKQYANALSLYQTSAAFDPTNAGNYVSEGQVYYYIASADSGAQNHAYMNDALLSVQKAIRLDPHSSLPYLDEAFTYEALENEQGAIAAFQNAVAVDPLNNLDDHLHLVQLYLLTRQNAKAIQVVSKLTAAFPPSLFSNPIWGDPSKEQWRDDLVQLTAMEAAAYKVEGNTAGANVATALAEQYAALKI